MCGKHVFRDEIICSGGQFLQCMGGGKKEQTEGQKHKRRVKCWGRTCLCCSIFEENLRVYLEHVLNHENAEISAGFVVNHYLTSMDTNNAKLCVWNK